MMFRRGSLLIAWSGIQGQARTFHVQFVHLVPLCSMVQRRVWNILAGIPVTALYPWLRRVRPGFCQQLVGFKRLTGL